MQRTKWCVTNVIYIPMDFRCSWHGAQTPMVRPRNCSHIQSLWHPWYWWNAPILLILCPILVAALVYQIHRISSIQLPSLISSFDHCHHINIRWLASWLQFWWHWQFWGLLPGEISEIISFILIAARAPTVVDLLLEKMRKSNYILS